MRVWYQRLLDPKAPGLEELPSLCAMVQNNPAYRGLMLLRVANLYIREGATAEAGPAPQPRP